MFKGIDYSIDVKVVVFLCPRVARQSQTPVRFPSVKQWLILKYRAEKSTYLKELDARKPLVESFHKYVKI